MEDGNKINWYSKGGSLSIYGRVDPMGALQKRYCRDYGQEPDMLILGAKMDTMVL